MEVPPELPRPLKVGQAVVARHPITRQLHDGIILTIKSNKYRVQFNRYAWLLATCVGSHCRASHTVAAKGVFPVLVWHGLLEVHNSLTPTLLLRGVNCYSQAPQSLTLVNSRYLTKCSLSTPDVTVPPGVSS